LAFSFVSTKKTPSVINFQGCQRNLAVNMLVGRAKVADNMAAWMKPKHARTKIKLLDTILSVYIFLIVFYMKSVRPTVYELIPSVVLFCHYV
jgi:hypothetical protein